MRKIHDEKSVETLIQLWELCDRYSRAELLHHAATESYSSESHRHRILFGHGLSHGCCKDSEQTMRRLDDILGKMRGRNLSTEVAAVLDGQDAAD